MEFKLLIGISLLVVMGLLYYLTSLGFAEIIKLMARKQIMCTYLKENRIIQIDDGLKFNQFVMSKKGYSFAFQDKDKEDTEWKHERERWEIIENKHYNIEDSMSGFALWCLKELGVYWFGGWLLGKKVRTRTVDLYHYDQQNSKLTVIEKFSPYLFATDTMYAWEIRNAEDSTGNPFRINFGVIATVTNPYIAWIENERWDKTFAAKAISSPIPFIKNHPFHVLSPDIKKSLEELKAASNGDAPINHDEIAEKFSKTVLRALKLLKLGLKFKSVELFNVDPENPAVFQAILNYYESRYTAEATIEKARGDADGNALKLKVERKDLKKRLQYLDQHLEAARLSTIKDTFKNVTVLGGDQMTYLIDPNKKNP
jgi:hypothetical protein